MDTNNKSKYWDIIFFRFKNLYYPPTLIREKDETFIKLFEEIKNKVILKTDLFEEAHGNKNLLFKLERKNNCVGIDISNAVVNAAKKHSKNSLLINCDVTNLPFDNESFDIIISTSTLDHIMYEDIIKSLKELNRVLKKNGRIFLTIDNYHNLLYRIEFVFWKIFNLYYRSKCFRISEIIELTKNADLKVKNIKTIMVFPAIIDKILILVQNIFKIDLNEAFEKMLILYKKFTKIYKYTSGRFIFVELVKDNYVK